MNFYLKSNVRSTYTVSLMIQFCKTDRLVQLLTFDQQFKMVGVVGKQIFTKSKFLRRYFCRWLVEQYNMLSE